MVKMLTEAEKIGVETILSKLSSDEILGLSKTVTNGLIISESIQEAIEVVCTYSKSASELLNRRKIKRQNLIEYLHKEKVHFNTDDEKKELIQVILKHWNSVVKTKQEDNSHALVESLGDSSNSSSLETTTCIENSPTISKTIHENIETQNGTVIDCESTDNVISLDAPSSNDTNLELVKQFMLWFYTLLNNAEKSNSGFSSDHFWSNSRMTYESNVDNGSSYEGAENVSTCLKSMVTDYFFLFNPHSFSNIHMDPHGLLIFDVSGVLNQNCNAIGTFNQRFGLIKDITASNSWKIKFTHVKFHIQPGQFSLQNKKINDEIMN